MTLNTDPHEITTPADAEKDLFPETFESRNTKIVLRNLDCFIYPIYRLDELTQLMRKNNIFVARFLVDVNGVLWFAEEGTPSKSVPAHYQMTEEHRSVACCLTAGNIEFSPDYQQIIRVNHKSGDFRPSYKSLAIFFAIVLRALEDHSVSLPVLLEEPLRVEQLSSSGGIDRVYNFTRSELNGLSSSINSVSPQPTEKKSIHCSRDKRERDISEIPDMPDGSLPPPAICFGKNGMFPPAAYEGSNSSNTQVPSLSLS